MKLLGLIDPADCAPCRESRLDHRHAAAAVLILEKYEVRRKLSGKLLFCLS
jgi:hypothetical protein